MRKIFGSERIKIVRRDGVIVISSIFNKKKKTTYIYIYMKLKNFL